MIVLNEGGPDSFGPEAVQTMLLSSLSSREASVEQPD